MRTDYNGWGYSAMKVQQKISPFLLLLGASLAFLASAHAAQWVQETPAASPIRSAQVVVRDGAWASVAPRSAAEEQAEIRAHFSAVNRILMRNETLSLAIAAARFEQSYGLALTREQRSALLAILAARREVQIARLAVYANAGRFPLNRHYATEARPIFVDAQGTHCAVGHLMALDGWEPEVIAIARATPNVLVREISGGPLVSWVLTSGLIQEEAALIQPAYFPAPVSGATKVSDLVVPGASLDRDGFRYENFGFSATGSGGATAPTAAQFGLYYGWPPTAIGGGFCPGAGTCVPSPDTFWISYIASPTSFGYLFTAPGQSVSLAIDYDVVALSEGLAIGGVGTFFDSLYGGFLPGFPGTGSVATSVDGGASGLLALLLTTEGYQYRDDASALFDTPASRVHIQHVVQFGDGAAFGSLDAVTLRAVPLPGSAALFGLAFAMLGRYLRRGGAATERR